MVSAPPSEHAVAEISSAWKFAGVLLIAWDALRLCVLLQVKLVGKERLVLDLSCRKRNGQYYVVTDRWQRFSELAVDQRTLNDLGRRPESMRTWPLILLAGIHPFSPCEQVAAQLSNC